MAHPWAVLGGHGFAAGIGVACGLWVPYLPLAAGLAVGLTVAVMLATRCLHPPGGATALTAVIGGPGIKALGWDFVWHPVLLNALLLVVLAYGFNTLFRGSRELGGRPLAVPLPNTGNGAAIRHEDFVYALSQIDTYVDISEEDLLAIYALARGHQKSDPTELS